MDEGDGCGCLLGLVAIGLAVMALISLAAIVDPFGSLPRVADIWADCEDDYATEHSECALDNRFPGFWWSVIGSLVYTAAAVGFGVASVARAIDLRRARAQRFDRTEAAAAYVDERRAFVRIAAVTIALGALPLVVAAG